jgi:small-conductance mechanosensitive channel
MNKSTFENAFQQILGFFTPDRLQQLMVALVVAVVGFILTNLLLFFVRRITRRYLSQQYDMLVRKAVRYTAAAVVLLVVLNVLGVRVGALLGAAGILGIAIGFASQTSMSNLISGLFLISEKPFEIGDVIKVGANTGIILSIDLLSVKIRTFDNQYIRVPNQMLLASELTNITRFPIRRMDINLSVAYRTDVQRLRTLLLQIAAENPYCLDEPEPLVVFTDFGASGLQFLYGVWFYKTDYLALRNSIMQEIKRRFDAEGIEIPYPHLSVYAGSATDPLPIRIVNGLPEPRAKPGRSEGGGRAAP